MKIIQSSPLKSARWPWPKMNIKEVAEAACAYKLYMPNIGYVQLPSLNDWNIELGEAANSKRLWINSIVSIHATLAAAISEKNSVFMEVAERLLDSYLCKCDSNEGVFKDAWKDEHAVANRLFVLTAFLHETCSTSGPSISQLDLLYHADRHAKWLMDDSHYVKNNHGVMMDLALAQFSNFTQSLDPIVSKEYCEKAVRRLEMMLDSTFDSDGCCTENSPTYHFVNYSLFSSARDFVEQLGLDVAIQRWDLILSRAKKVGNLFIKRDGTIPVIGDSEEKLGTFFPVEEYQARLGYGYFPSSGIFVANIHDFYFTIRGGGRTFNHRHVDDSSITLSYKNVDFIVDPGLYNYDINDKLRRWFTSPNAHSGFYAESAGKLRYANYSSPSDFSSLHDFNDEGMGGFTIKCQHKLSPEAPVGRVVTKVGNVVTLTDSLKSDIPIGWRQVFILHPNCRIYLDEKSISFTINNGGAAIKIFIQEGVSFKVCDFNYSSCFMKLQKCQGIVISGKGSDCNVQTIIELM
jgi:hypothetical protein